MVRGESLAVERENVDGISETSSEPASLDLEQRPVESKRDVAGLEEEAFGGGLFRRPVLVLLHERVVDLLVLRGREWRRGLHH